MTTQILERQLKEARQNLHDAVVLATKYKLHMGLIDQEELARVSSSVTGVAFRPVEFDLSDRNGEQGR